jgi:hypothetical protein
VDGNVRSRLRRGIIASTTSDASGLSGLPDMLKVVERNCGGDVWPAILCGYGRLSHSLSNRPTNGRGHLTPQLESHRTNRGKYKLFTHATCPRVRFVLQALAPILDKG